MAWNDEYDYRWEYDEQPDFTRYEKYHEMPDGSEDYGSGFSGGEHYTELGGAFGSREDAESYARDLADGWDHGVPHDDPNAPGYMETAWSAIEVYEGDDGYWHVAIEYNDPADGEWT